MARLVRIAVTVLLGASVVISAEEALAWDPVPDEEYATWLFAQADLENHAFLALTPLCKRLGHDWGLPIVNRTGKEVIHEPMILTTTRINHLGLWGIACQFKFVIYRTHIAAVPMGATVDELAVHGEVLKILEYQKSSDGGYVMNWRLPSPEQYFDSTVHAP